jgi:DNA polymerase-3 subunit epsilon
VTKTIHGITDDRVKAAPSLLDLFSGDLVQTLLAGAQPCAYNAPYDRRYMPWAQLTSVLDPDWPWIDPLVWVKELDKYAKGSWRHKLTTTCARHGVELGAAHDALNDALACGQLAFKLLPRFAGSSLLADVLSKQLRLQAQQWSDFEAWKARNRPAVAL